MEMKSSPQQTHRLPIRVYYEDTDAAGVVYYANYFKFCERARTEWLRGGGFDQARLKAERHIVFVVSSVQGDYLAGAELDDSLEIVTHIEKLGRASIVFAQQVERQGQTLFRARVTVACVDWRQRKPAPIPEDIRETMKALQ